MFFKSVDAFHVVVFIVASVGVVSAVDIGSFWQITDLHFDPNYSVNGTLDRNCHKFFLDLLKKKRNDAPGMFGDPRCDTPWLLVQSAVEAMKKLEASPDFVLWTGDTGPHSDKIGESTLTDLMKKTTDLMKTTFNGTYLIPMLGNHDVIPGAQMPPDSQNYYSQILKQWDWGSFLPKDAQQTFEKGGYYSWMISPGMSIVVLNTNLHFVYDKLTKNMVDPAGMFGWLRKLLDLEKSNKRKVMIATHIPPGVYERTSHSFHLYPQYNDEYVDIIRDYQDIIGAQVFGHEHKDSIRLFLDKDGKPINVGLLAPAVTPWKNTYIPGDPPNNPGIRLVKYDRDNGNILDIFQYYLDLNAANKAGKADWKLEYQFTKSMGVPDLKPPSIQKLVAVFSNDTKLFETLYSWNSVLYSNATCNSTCKMMYLCAVQHMDVASYNACMAKDLYVPHPNPVVPSERKPPAELFTQVPTTSFHRRHHRPTHHPHHHQPIPKYMMYIIVGLCMIVFVLFLVIVILCCQRRMLYPQTRYLRVPHVTVN